MSKSTIAIYARVSTADQTCAQQLTVLREYASRLGGTVVEYIETASGRKDDRPVLKALLAECRKRKVACVVVTKMDRFGRSISKLISDIKDLDSLGVRFVALEQGIDTDKKNAAGRLLLHILAAIAEFERELISDRTRAGMDRVRAAGTKLGAPRKAIDASRVMELHAAGTGVMKIAAALGNVSRETVRRMIVAETARSSR